MAGVVADEAKNDPKRGFVRGYFMETLAPGVPFLAAFQNPGAWGRGMTEVLDHSRTAASSPRALPRTPR
jgi:hypothetical protein